MHIYTCCHIAYSTGNSTTYQIFPRLLGIPRCPTLLFLPLLLPSWVGFCLNYEHTDYPKPCQVPLTQGFVDDKDACERPMTSLNKDIFLFLGTEN